MGKGGKGANTKASVAKEPQSLELKIEQGGYCLDFEYGFIQYRMAMNVFAFAVIHIMERRFCLTLYGNWLFSLFCSEAVFFFFLFYFYSFTDGIKRSMSPSVKLFI